MTSSGTRVVGAPLITSWHAAVFFQAFMAFFTATLGVWYYVGNVSPGSISEYLPRELTPDNSTIALFFIFALIWLGITYLSWKGRRASLLGGAVFGLANLVLTTLGFVGGSLSAPSFGDFLFFPLLVFVTIVSVKAWKSLKRP